MLDFGLAKQHDTLAQRERMEHGRRRRHHRRRARSFGTVAYMAPEQAEGKAPMRDRTSSRSASCSTRWRLDERPFSGDTSLSTLTAIMRDTPRPVTDMTRRSRRSWAA